MDYITLATNALILFVLQMMLACLFNMVWDKMLAYEKINEEILDNIW